MAAPTFRIKNLQVTSYLGSAPTTQVFTFSIWRPGLSAGPGGGSAGPYTTPVSVTGTATVPDIVLDATTLANIGYVNAYGPGAPIAEFIPMCLYIQVTINTVLFPAQDPITVSGTIYIDETAASTPFTSTLFGSQLGFISWRQHADTSLPRASGETGLTPKVGTMANFNDRLWNVVNTYAPNEWARPVSFNMTDKIFMPDHDYASLTGIGQGMRRLGKMSLGQDTTNPRIRWLLKDVSMIPMIHAYDTAGDPYAPPGDFFPYFYPVSQNEPPTAAGFATWATRIAAQTAYAGWSPATEVSDYPLSDEPNFPNADYVAAFNTGAYGYTSLIINATGGTFTLTFNGQTTSALAYNITAPALQTAVQGLSSIGSGNALVSFANNTYYISLWGSLVSPSLVFTANASGLTGGTSTATVGAAVIEVATSPQALSDFQTYLSSQSGLTPSMFGAASWSNVKLLDASYASGTLAQRTNYWWSMFWMSRQSAVHHGNASAALQAKFSSGIHTRSNLAEWSGRFWDDTQARGYVGGSTGAYDYAEWSRVGGSTVLWQEDWFNYVQSWQWSIIAAHLRSAAFANNIGFGAYVIPSSMDSTTGSVAGMNLRRLMTVYGNGSKTINTYTYGPFYMWSDGWDETMIRNPALAQDTVTAMKMLAASEDLMFPGTPYANKVAIYYPRVSLPWEVGKGANDIANPSGMSSATTSHVAETHMLYLALVHSGIQADWIDDADLLNTTTMAKYKVLYLTAPHIPTEGQTALSAWVNGGGTLVTTPGAGTLDRYNSSLTTISTLGGFSESAWNLNTIAIFGPSNSWPITDVNSSTMTAYGYSATTGDWRPALTASGATVKATFNDNSAPAITYKAVGSGARWHFSFFAGISYMVSGGWGGTGSETTLPPGANFNATLRNWITSPITSAPASVLPPVAHTTYDVDLLTLTSANGWAVTVINWDIVTKTNILIRVRPPFTPTKITSYNNGNLTITPTADGYTVTLPTLQYADVLRVYSGTAPSVPSAPTSPIATANTGHRITVSWTAVNGATSYAVWRSTTSNGTYTQIGWVRSSATSGTITCMDKTCNSGTTYYYYVTASNSEGTSAQSSTASAATPAAVSSTWTQVQATGSYVSHTTSATFNWTTQPTAGHLLIATNHARITTRTVTNGSTTAQSTTLTTATNTFGPSDVGKTLTETGNAHIPKFATITGYTSPTQVTISAPAFATGSSLSFTITGGTAADLNTPSGWSIASQQVLSGLITTIYYKIAGSNEGSVTVSTNAPDAGLDLYLFEYSGNNTTLAQVLGSANTAYPLIANNQLAQVPWLESSVDNPLLITVIGTDDGPGQPTFNNTWTNGWTKATASIGLGFSTAAHLMPGLAPALATSQETTAQGHVFTGASAIFVPAGTVVPPMVEYDDLLPI